MRLTGSRAYARPAPTPTMPPGLVELMEGLAKDVLKHNPENVYEFCAAHMQKLLEIRDGPAPPRKQLSLEQKIANAQEKIRQRIKYRHLRRDINTSEQSNENHDLEDEPPVTSAIETIVENSNENTPSIQPVGDVSENTSTIQPLEEISDENASVIQPVEKTSAIQAVVQTVIENKGATQPVVHEKIMMANEVEIYHEPDAIITSNETSADENPSQDNNVQPKEASQVAHEPKDVVIATQTLYTEDSNEKNCGEVIENFGVDTKEISDIEANVKLRDDTGVSVQSKHDVGPTLGNIDHAGNAPQIAGNPEAQFKESEPTISGMGNSADGKVDNLNGAALENETNKLELNEVASTLPLANINDTGVSHHIDDIKTMDKNVVEEEKFVVKELTVIKKYATKIEPEDSINGVLEKHEIIKENDSADIHPEVITINKGDQIESKERVDGVITTDKGDQIESKESVDGVVTTDKGDQNESKESVDSVVTTDKGNQIESKESVDGVVTTDKGDQIESKQSADGVVTTDKGDQIESKQSADGVITTNQGEQIETKESVDGVVTTDKGDQIESKQSADGVITTDKGDQIESKQSADGVVTTDKGDQIESKQSADGVINTNQGYQIETKESVDGVIMTDKGYQIETKESVDGVITTDKGDQVESKESVDGVITTDKRDQIESKESVDGVITTNKGDQFQTKGSVDVKRASEDNLVELDHDKVSFQSEDATVDELTINRHEIPHQNETDFDKNLIISSTDTEVPEISNPQISEIDSELTAGQVISAGKTEQAIVDDSLKNDDVNDHKNQGDYGTEVDKQLNDDNDKLSDQERSYSGQLIVEDPEETHDYIRTLHENDTIIQGDKTLEYTAVSGMDLETAAVTIQKVFRTFLFSKSRASTLDDTVNENSLDGDIEKKDEPEYILKSSNLNKERRTLGISRMDTVLQTVNEEKSLSLSDESSLSSAATTIQAHVRGFLVRNRLTSNKTGSISSLVNSDRPSFLSLDGDVNEPKKTILNIHIVPERGQFMSRDESLLTSIDLPLDNSPPSSINLHPLGYDRSAERRKQLKREDAVQSISPPSNNSGKLSEEIDSVKDTLNDASVDTDVKLEHEFDSIGSDKPQDADTESCDTTLTISSIAETVVDADTYNPREVLSSPDKEADNKINEVVSSSDEMDVVTPYTTITEKTAKVASVESENDEKPKLVHSGEFHDIVVQTQVKRSESSVVREFKNVLVYFLLWDKT